MGQHHHHHHGHCHHHDSEGKGTKGILLAFTLNLSFAVIEVIGGLYTNSMAILSDALHDLGDSVSLGLAYILEKYSQRAPDAKYNFGYRRFSLLGALINAVILFSGAIFIIKEGLERLQSPPEVKAEGMILLAFLGIFVNGLSAWKMRKQTGLNQRMVMLHLLEDLFGWIAILVVATIMYFYPLPILDPILSLLISSFVLWNVIKVGRKLLAIFMQQVPEELEIARLVKEVEALPSVLGTHALKGWTLDGSEHSLSLHVTVDHNSSFQTLIELKKEIRGLFLQHSIKFSAIEFESNQENCEGN